MSNRWRLIAYRPCRIVAVCACACLVVPAAVRSDAGQSWLASPIERLVSIYRHGDNAAAVAEFLQWDAKRLEREGALAADAAAADVGALVLMHTSAAVARGTFGSGDTPPASDKIHYPRALALVNSLSQRAQAAPDPAVRTFCRSWYIVAVSLWCASRSYADAAAVASDGRRRFGDDPEILLAAGSAAEAQMVLASGAQGRNPVVANITGKLSDQALNAEDWLGRAVSLAPGLVEARLRHGRVLFLLNRIPQARKELEETLADATAANHAFASYLAALFLGELLERSGQEREARAAYEKAVSLHPEYQVAHLALGRLLVEGGRPEEGWAAARRVFGDGTRPRNPEQDPWFLYPSAQFWRAQGLLQAMFEWVRQ